MPAQQQHWIRSAYLSGSTGAVAVGYAVVSNGTAYVVATAANRTSYGRSEGVTLTAGDDDDTAIEIQCAGVVPNSITGLGAGAATWVIVSSTGALERDTTPDSGEDVIGKCNARGDLFLAPGVWDDGNYAGGGAGFTAPTGTGFMTTTGGAMNAAATAYPATVAMGGTGQVSLTSGNILTGNGTSAVGSFAPGTGVQTFLTTPSSANLAAAVTDETGTGALVFANTPTLVTPVIGAATGTSAALTGFWSTGATPATTGAGRMSNGESIYGRSGGTNYRVLNFDSGLLTLGESGAGITDLIFYGQNSITFAIGSTTKAYIDSTGIRLNDGTGQYYTIGVSNLAADRTVTLPLLTGNDTFVTEAHTQTLINKTLTSPRITDAGADHFYTISPADLSADRTLNLPLITGTDTLAVLGLGQTFTGVNKFNTYVQMQSTETGDGLQIGNNLWIVGQRQAGGKVYLIATDTSNALLVGTSANPSQTNIIAGTGFDVALFSGTTHAASFGASTTTLKTTALVADGNARCKAYSNIANVQTTDATVTSLYTWTILDEAHTLVTAEVVNCISTGATGAAYVRRTRFERDGGTVATTAVEDSYTNEDTAGWDCTIDNSTSTGRVRVTGAAATTLDWGGVTTRIEVSHA